MKATADPPSPAAARRSPATAAADLASLAAPQLLPPRIRRRFPRRAPLARSATAAPPGSIAPARIWSRCRAGRRAAGGRQEGRRAEVGEAAAGAAGPRRRAAGTAEPRRRAAGRRSEEKKKKEEEKEQRRWSRS